MPPWRPDSYRMPAPLGPGRAAVLGRPRGFLPTDLSGLVLWLAADKISGLSDGDPVTTWVDSSGSGNNATQATAAKRPTYKVNILNGKPVVRFDGVDDWLQIGTTDLLSKQDGSTVWAVATLGSISDDRFLYAESQIGPAYLLRFTSGKGQFGKFNGTVWSFATTTAALTTGTTYLLVGTYSAVSGTTLHVNGTLNGSSVTTGHSADAIVETGVGRRSPAADYFDRDLAEVGGYTTNLGTVDRQRLESYLNSRYALW